MSARCLVIGWDGADSATIAAMLESGELPVLGSLRASGGLRPLAPLPGLGDDGHWATFSTGVGPGTHGRFHYKQYDPSVGKVGLMGRSRMTTPPFWESLARTGAKVATLDVPKSPLANADGCRQLADWMPHGEDDRIISGSPASVVNRARATLPKIRFSDCHGVLSGSEPEALFDTVIARVPIRTGLLLDWLHDDAWDLVVAVFAESHCIAHHCWHGHDPAHPARDDWSAPFDPMRAVLRDMDRALGQLIDAAGPDAAVVVFAPLGMDGGAGPGPLIDAVVERLDRALMDERRSFGTRLRRLVHRRRRRPEQGWLIRTTPTDAVSTAIRLNVAGRERAGVIRSATDFEAVRQRVVDELVGITDPDSGHRPVSRVVRTDIAFPGERSDAFADLLAVWDTAHDVSTVDGPTVGRVTVPPTPARTGNHRAGGWAVSNDRTIIGPEANALALEDLSHAIAGHVSNQAKSRTNQ